MYTVKGLSELAGISIRTLHYYHEIGLLKPSHIGENGYRFYEDEDIFRLQQILFYRELDLSLDEIKAILRMPDFDMLAALRSHREGLAARIQRLRSLMQTIDSTILYLTGEADMSKNKLFAGFSDEEEQQYKQEARERWGDQEVDVSYQRWNNYAPEQQEKIKAEGQIIYQELADLIEHAPDSPEIQQLVGRWHQHLRYFYEPSIDRLRGLGQLYIDHPDFASNFRELHEDLPEFMRDAINHYCDKLEE